MIRLFPPRPGRRAFGRLGLQGLRAEPDALTADRDAGSSNQPSPVLAVILRLTAEGALHDLHKPSVRFAASALRAPTAFAWISDVPSKMV